MTADSASGTTASEADASGALASGTTEAPAPDRLTWHDGGAIHSAQWLGSGRMPARCVVVDSVVSGAPAASFVSGAPTGVPVSAARGARGPGIRRPSAPRSWRALW